MRSEGYLRPDSPEVWNDGHMRHTVGWVAIAAPEGGQRIYRVHRLIVPPDANIANGSFINYVNGADYLRQPERSVFAQPFAWQSAMKWATSTVTHEMMLGYAEAPELTKSRWISIVDEFPTQRRTTPQPWQSIDYDEPNIPYSATTSLKEGQLSRRVVEMNATGFVLRDRKWEFSADGTHVSGGGLGEQYVYKTVRDYFGDTVTENLPASVRQEAILVEHRSVGWSAADMPDAGGQTHGDIDGLVEFHTYALVDDANVEGGKRIEQIGEGIQKGADSPGATASRMYAEKTITKYDEPSNTEIEIRLACLRPVLQAEFDSLTAPASLSLAYLDGLPAQGFKSTVTITKRLLEPDPEQPDQPARERRILQREIIGTPRQLRPAGAWYYPVEKEWYDEHGSSLWAASGLVRNPLVPAGAADPLDALMLTYYQRQSDGYASGRAEHTVVDATPGTHATSVPGTNVEVPVWPETGWERLGGTQSSNFITSFLYDGWGLSDTLFPNGRRWARRIILIPSTDPTILESEKPGELPDYIAREYIFNDLDPEYSTGLFRTESMGQVKDYGTREPKGAPFVDRHVTFEQAGGQAFPLDFQEASQVAFQRLAAVKLGVDGMGRLQRADMLEWVEGFGWMAAGTKEINDLGEVYRELELDGTITRTTRSSLGQDMRKYVGTQDDGWVSPTNSQGEPLPYNMVLVERREYGSNSHNAWQPTVVRRYGHNPTWYREHYGNAPSPDPEGVASLTQYDWRMRPVRTDVYSKGDPADPSTVRESTALTFMDHADQARLVVTYGRGTLTGISGGLDPVTLEPLANVPSALAFYVTSPRPTSVVEMFYGPDGTMTEQRSYDVAWNPSSGGNPPYHAEYTFKGKNGREVFAQKPGQATSITRLDSQGRTAQSVTVAPGLAAGSDPYAYELTRTDFTYDRDGNVVDLAQWERVATTGNGLGASNAVRMRTVSWYDKKKRLTASADLGTEQTSGYVYGQPVFVRYVQGDIPRSRFQCGSADLQRDHRNARPCRDTADGALVDVHV